MIREHKQALVWLICTFLFTTLALLLEIYLPRLAQSHYAIGPAYYLTIGPLLLIAIFYYFICYPLMFLGSIRYIRRWYKKIGRKAIIPLLLIVLVIIQNFIVPHTQQYAYISDLLFRDQRLQIVQAMEEGRAPQYRLDPHQVFSPSPAVSHDPFIYSTLDNDVVDFVIWGRYSQRVSSLFYTKSGQEIHNGMYDMNLIQVHKLDDHWYWVVKDEGATNTLPLLQSNLAILRQLFEALQSFG